LELNENGLLQLVHREFFNVPQNDKGKLIVIRMHDISTKSIVNTKNTGINADFNSGIIIDIGKEDRLLPNEILLEINPQTIDRITLSLNHDISGFAGFHYQIEFLLILKVIEKEPSYLEYGTLNNII
jgi:metal-dependent hydrolase (beta-lactamase superfamily II)